MSWKRVIGETYIKFKFRANRGDSYLEEVKGLITAIQQGGIIILLIKTYFNVLVPLWILPIIWIIQKGFQYALGYCDEKYLHWWAFETRFSQENNDINPVQYEMITKIRNIEKLLLK